MTTPAFQRDNILSDEERAVSARKCVRLLGDVSMGSFRGKDWSFFCDQLALSNGSYYRPTERQLAYLRDLVERYCT